MQEKIIKQFSAKVESSTGENTDKYLYVKSYISTYNVDLGNDRILPGAFTKSIQERTSQGKNIPALWQHDMDILLGHAIEITEDEKGILVVSRLPKSHWRVKDEIIPLLENGSLQEMSIGFIVVKYSENEEADERVIEEGKLLEYSFVTLAMNPEATIEGFKSIETINSLKEVEKLLKSKGFSNSEAKTLISKVKEFSKTREELKETPQREVETKQEPDINLEETLKTIQELTLINQINQLCLKTK